MEGNKHTIACTLHTCDGGNGNWNYCDGGGCQVNAFNYDSGLMCPGGYNLEIFSYLFQIFSSPVAPSTLTTPLPSPTSRRARKPTPGWVRAATMGPSTCATMVGTWATWPTAMGTWSSQLLCGVVEVLTWKYFLRFPNIFLQVLTWIGWMVWLAVEESVTLMEPVLPWPTLSFGNRSLKMY